MTDTPEHIKDLQLKIWLSKTPGQRIYQQLKDNEDLFHFWANAKTIDKKMDPAPQKKQLQIQKVVSQTIDH
ncbi:MAG: hypothetical protein ABIX01_17735 [Chitinophagaceae bacterium]